MRLGQSILCLVFLLTSTAFLGAQTQYERDIDFAVTEIPKQCGPLLKQKQIDWAGVTAQFREDVKKVDTDEQHLRLLIRLVARLKDGHAGVRPLEKGKGVAYPNRYDGATGPGMFWCIIDDKVYVKNAWSTAKAAGVSPGMEVVTVEGAPARQWIDQRLADFADTVGQSTQQQSLAWMCHWGLAAQVGTEMHLDLRDTDGRLIGAVVKYQRASFIPVGPAVFPGKLEGDSDIKFGKLPSGVGYIHLRRCPGDLPDRMDKALAAIGNVPGLIVDLRANGGGGFDHEALMGRFIPAGKRMNFAKAYDSAGPNPYGGPVVVIIDGNCRSAGETLTAILKEDGRAYVIGESASAGMSSQKTTIDLPSGLFSLYVSTRSNMQRTNGGTGIEGIGVPPHELAQYDPKDLAAGKDTLIRKAEQLLAHFPQDKVAYNSADFGWTPPQAAP